MASLDGYYEKGGRDIATIEAEKKQRAATGGKTAGGVFTGAITGGMGALRDKIAGVPAQAPTSSESFLSQLSSMPRPTAIPGAGISSAALDAFPHAMSQIEAKYARALAELDRRQQAANTAVASMPGRLNDQYATGQANLSAFAQPLVTAANAQIPVGPGTGPGIDASGLAPIQAAMAASLAERQADVPLLGQGITNYLGGQRTVLDMARAEEAAAMQLQQAQMQQEIAMQQAQMAQQASLANADRQDAYDSRLFDAANERDLIRLKNELEKGSSGGLVQFGVSPERALAFTPQRQAELRARPQWKQMFADYQTALTTNPDTAVPGLVAKYGGNYPDTLSLFLATVSG